MVFLDASLRLHVYKPASGPNVYNIIMTDIGQFGASRFQGQGHRPSLFARGLEHAARAT